MQCNTSITLQTERRSPALQYRTVEPQLGVIVARADHADKGLTGSFSLVSHMKVSPA